MGSETVILASASARRRELFTWILERFTALSTDIDETPYPNEDPIRYCKRMALGKAIAAYQSKNSPDAIILSADTTVILNQTILGKPDNAAHAVEMLKSLSGNVHTVCTALSLVFPSDAGAIRLSTHCLTAVHMNRLSEELIQAYVASGDPLGKAGAYAIQNPDFALVAEINGCYANVVGLPLCHCGALFSRAGNPLRTHACQSCRKHIRYNCETDVIRMIQNAVFETATDMRKL